MTNMDTGRQCPIHDGIKLICPYCSGLLEVPMCQAVNGEKIKCPHCQREFEFPREPD